MTKSKLIHLLLTVHQKYSRERRSGKDSQICTLWSTSNPPDILEDTAPLNAIGKALGFYLSEDEAVELYDMTIEEGAEYLSKLLGEQH